MRETMTAPVVSGVAPTARPRPVLVYSADAIDASVAAWLRQYALQRSVLAQLTSKPAARYLAVQSNALLFRSPITNGLDASLRRDGELWALSVGALDETFCDPDHATGIFCAVVLGEARLKVETKRNAVSRLALEIPGAAGRWTEILVSGVTRLTFGASSQVKILVNAN